MALERTSIPQACRKRRSVAIARLCRITLVLGGARSGKSQYAERLVVARPAPWIYIATAQAFDAEMRARITEHQARRDGGWQTIEAPVDLARAMAPHRSKPVLIDCLTLWLTNLMLGGHDIPLALRALEAELDTRDGPVVLVSNEVGLGLVPETPLGRSFRDEAGRLNQRIAQKADHVAFMVAGLPLTLK